MPLPYGSKTCADQVRLTSASATGTRAAKVSVSGRSSRLRSAVRWPSSSPDSSCSSTSASAALSSEPSLLSVACISRLAPGPGSPSVRIALRRVRRPPRVWK